MSDMLPAILATDQNGNYHVVQNIIARKNMIKQAMSSLMKDGTHYGKLPGVEGKCLLKPGAELICTIFNLAPEVQTEIIDQGNGHREYRVTVNLHQNDITEGARVGVGIGSCSTLESKYRYRTRKLQCPGCGQEAIMFSKFDDGGWYCNAKAGGCGAKYAKNDQSITGQERGKVENPDIADTYNTVWKMAKKRALVDAVITKTSASEMFVEGLDDGDPLRPTVERLGELRKAMDDSGWGVGPLKSVLIRRYGEDIICESIADAASIVPPDEVDALIGHIRNYPIDKNAETKSKELKGKLREAKAKSGGKAADSGPEAIDAEPVPSPDGEADNNSQAGSGSSVQAKPKTIDSVSEECWEICNKKNLKLDNVLSMSYPDIKKSDLTLAQWNDFLISLKTM
jgi:hypothetical protein